MQTNNEYLDEWPVRPYSKRELAIAYAPDISPCSALNRLAGWVRHHQKLSHDGLPKPAADFHLPASGTDLSLFGPSLNEDLPCSLSHAYIGIASCVY